MSDPTDPTDPTHPARHPDEALAGIVGGTATGEERRLVEAHLQSCSRCREELRLARSARAAASSLTEAEAPGLDAQAIIRAGRTVVPLAPRRPAVPWRVVAGGLVAASLAGLLVFGVFRSNAGSPTATSAAGPRTTAAPEAGAPGSTTRNFTKASIDALADALASGSPVPRQSAFGGNAAPNSSDLTAARSCAAAAAGSSEAPVYATRAAFLGRPAFVTAFPASGQGHTITVVVTSTTGCAVYYAAHGAPAVPSGA